MLLTNLISIQDALLTLSMGALTLFLLLLRYGIWIAGIIFGVVLLKKKKKKMLAAALLVLCVCAFSVDISFAVRDLILYGF